MVWEEFLDPAVGMGGDVVQLPVGDGQMQDAITPLFIQLSKRAEKADRQTLIESFVDVGPLLAVLSTVDNQVLYGRRGTGKTHALVYLAETVHQRGDIPIYVDLRTVGSTGGLYSDGSIHLAERATRLLVDTLAAVHEELLSAALQDDSRLNLAEIGPVLDEFADAITEVTVTGNVREELGAQQEGRTAEAGGLTVKAGLDGAAVSYEGSTAAETIGRSDIRMTTEGTPAHRVHFGRVLSLFERLTRVLDGKRIWLLLDEWSVVPLELQPYLADLVRRAVFPVGSISVKIGAIEKRCRFQALLDAGEYVGIELGGDASADINMDDYMVFDNDEGKALKFFRALLFRHVKSLADQQDIPIPDSPKELIRIAFTQENVFREFVRAAEGIPRDAFYILSLAAQKDYGGSISMDTIRKCSKTWYQRDKETAVSANPRALGLLHWIIDEVIAHRRARAFLLRRGVANELVDSLFDSRVLHLLKRNISAHDQPGIRYDVYKIDYGCYVDLLSTGRSPQGLLDLDEGGYLNVPPDDYRAIRRAILDIEKFQQATAQP